MRSPTIPPDAEIVRTFSAYHKLCNAFLAGKLHLLIIVGRPGLSKTHYFEEHLGYTSHLIKGWAAPTQVYIDCYHHRNKLVILDDAEVLWGVKHGRILLRSLTEHKPRKLITCTSTNKDLQKAGVPQSFLTSSKFAIVANRFVFGEAEEYAAILDRAHLIYFDPMPSEVHAYVATWFWDQQIFDYVGERLHMMESLSARTYLKAWERRNAGGNWKRLIEERYCHQKSTLLVQQLELDPDLRTVKERADRFIEMAGGCRATYFNLKKQLQANGQLVSFQPVDISQVSLVGTPPEELDLVAEVAAAQDENEAEYEGDLDDE